MSYYSHANIILGKHLKTIENKKITKKIIRKKRHFLTFVVLSIVYSEFLANFYILAYIFV